MGVSLLAVRHTEPEERRHGTWFGNQLAYDAMATGLRTNPFHPRLVQGLSPYSYNGMMPCGITLERWVASRVEKSMNQQKYCAKIDTRHSHTMPVSIFNS